jgi:ABC-type sugar transport system ATPase subunit
MTVDVNRAPATDPARAVMPVLEMEGVTKVYGGNKALDEVSFAVRPGEIHALLGENGAGKSTLAKIISGAAQHDDGIMRFAGVERRWERPAQASAAGVTMIYQETSLVEQMTVAQNLFLGREKLLNRLSPLNNAAREILNSYNFHIRPDAMVGALGAAQKQMVEIARGLHRSAQLVIFDEPTATVTPEEKQQLFMSMQSMKGRGIAMVFITHNIEEALSEADTITVLRDGVVQASSRAADLTREDIVRMMVGRDVEYARRAPGRAPDPVPRLEVDNLTLVPTVRNMSFSAFGGEILGMAGLVGAGRSEVAQIVAGRHKRRRLRGGEVRLNGRPVRFRTPREARRMGIVYVTEDRKAAGIFGQLSIAENIALGHLASAERFPFWASPRRRRRIGAEFVEKFRVRTLDPSRAKLEELSGGNQQKVVLAKSLTRQPEVVIIDEPTRGVDVGAIDEIHAMIRNLANQGVAVIIISSYLPEVLALSDRILVARQGHVVAEFSRAEATEENIMFAAVH